jgi:hypothetical protein
LTLMAPLCRNCVISPQPEHIGWDLTRTQTEEY